MSSSSAELTRRPATAADRPFLWRLHRLALRPYVEQTWGWDEAWQCNHFEQRFTPDRKEILYLGGRPIGMIEVEHRADDVFLALIEIDPAHQGRGIGARLIREVIEEAERAGKPVRLQVLRVNPARRLYERLGFEVEGETETHLLMHRSGER